MTTHLGFEFIVLDSHFFEGLGVGTAADYSDIAATATPFRSSGDSSISFCVRRCCACHCCCCCVFGVVCTRLRSGKLVCELVAARLQVVEL